MNRTEAIKILRETHDKALFSVRTALETLIPELKESEDERIMEAIEGAIRVYGKTQGEWLGGYDMDTLVVHLRVAFGALKEQKEQPTSAIGVLVRAGLKPYKDGDQWCILAGDNIQEGICGFGDTIDEALYQFLMDVLEQQKEQKPSTPEDIAVAYQTNGFSKRA